MRKAKNTVDTINVYTFTCPVCNKSLTVDKPFHLQYCPFCALCLADYAEGIKRSKRGVD